MGTLAHTTMSLCLGVALIACVPPPPQQPQQPPQQGYGQQGYRAGHAPGATAEPQGTGVFVNGVQLTAQQLQGAQVPRGRYWYDARSGLWGHESGPVRGVVGAGLRIGGPLHPQASAGTTNVFVNGRNLHAQDLAYLNQLLRTYVRPGNYWLDASGNMGVVGGAPLINLVQAARARGGRDNFWGHNRTGAIGNESGGAGYVCVDGKCGTYGM